MASKRDRTLEERVNTLENYFKIGLAVCLILGVSGGVLGTLVSNALSRASAAQTIATTARDEVAEVRDSAIEAVNKTATSAVQAELVKQMPGAFDSRFDALVSQIQISLGPERFLDYKKMSDGNIDHKCNSNEVAFGWSFGKTNTDIAFWCRPISVAVRKP